MQVYWTDLDLATHAAIRSGPDANSPLIDGIEEWGPPITIMLPNLREAGFQKKLSQGWVKGWVYEVAARVCLKGEGANLSATIEIADQKTELVNDDGSPRDEPVVVIKEESIMICEEDFNPNPRSGA